jgi:hypothetical protein
VCVLQIDDLIKIKERYEVLCLQGREQKFLAVCGLLRK